MTLGGHRPIIHPLTTTSTAFLRLYRGANGRLLKPKDPSLKNEY
jgi:hypothetical protein